MPSLTKVQATFTDPNISTLNGMTDVTLSSVQNGQALVYNGTAWVNGAAGSTLTIQEEGTPLATDATVLNFVGSTVTATGTGGTKTITITGASGSGIGNLVEDTTPQLGGTLDINGQSISAGSNTLSISGTNSNLISVNRADTTGPTIRLTNGESTDNHEAWINLWGSTGSGTNRTNMFEINAINMDAFQINVDSAGTFYWSFGGPASGRELELTSAALYPSTDNGLDLGSSTNRWNNIYTGDIQLSNEGSQNEVDGSWGKWTIQEGETDLFLLNRRNGKKYKFTLEEVV